MSVVWLDVRGLWHTRDAEAILMLQVPLQERYTQAQQDFGVACPPAVHDRFGQCESGLGNNCS